MRKGEETTGIYVQSFTRCADVVSIQKGKMISLRYIKKMTPGLASE